MTVVETVADAVLVMVHSTHRANLVEDLSKMSAATIKECQAKARVLRAINTGECGPGSFEDLADSLARDVLALGH